MSEEINKFTKYMFLVGGFVPLTFSIAFFFLWEWFFRGIQQWPFDDPGMPLVFGSAVLSFAVMGFVSFFKVTTWSQAKIPIITYLVWCVSGVIVMLIIQFTMPVHNWNWFNTLSYLAVGLGFALASILEIRKRK